MQGRADERFQEFLDGQDFAPATIKAMRLDYSKWVRWYEVANAEPYEDERVTVRDIADFRRWLREERGQATASVNRALATLRRYFRWATEQGLLSVSPIDGIKDLKAVRLAPRGLERPQVRRILRSLTLRGRPRDEALVALMLFAGMRVGEVVGMAVEDVLLGERSGQVIVRNGKGNKERTIPLGIEARRPLARWLEQRPATKTNRVFLGRSGKPLREDGIRYLCEQLGIVAGVKLTPHMLRHTFATIWLSENNNDLVGLAQLLGHDSIDTTARYCQRQQEELQGAVDRMRF